MKQFTSNIGDFVFIALISVVSNCLAMQSIDIHEKHVFNQEFHCPNLVRVDLGSDVEVIYQAMTHPKITHPEVLGQFPLSEKLFVIRHNSSESTKTAFPQFTLDLASEYRIKNSSSIASRYREDESWVSTLALSRLQNNEEFLEQALSDNQRKAVDRIFFWQLVQKDGLVCTLVANRYILPVFNQLGIQRTNDEIDKVSSAAIELSEEMRRKEKELIEKYFQILDRAIPSDLRLKMAQMDVADNEILICYLDVLSHDTRRYLKTEDWIQFRPNRKYRYAGLAGMILEAPQSYPINPEIEIELRFLELFIADKEYQKNFDQEGIGELKRIWNELLKELAVNESQFAEFALDKPEKLGFEIRNKKIESEVRRSIDEIRKRLKSDSEKFDTMLTVAKLRVLGISFALEQLSSSADTKTELKVDLKSWLKEVDQAFHDADLKTLKILLGCVSDIEANAIIEILGERPVEIYDGFSKLRNNLRLVFRRSSKHD